MNWQLILSTFISVFVAELGDKTQLATMSLAGGNAGASSKWAVFIGASLALVASVAVAVVAGELVTRVVSPSWLRRIAGTIFIILGVMYWVSELRGGAQAG